MGSWPATISGEAARLPHCCVIQDIVYHLGDKDLTVFLHVTEVVSQV